MRSLRLVCLEQYQQCKEKELTYPFFCKKDIRDERFLIRLIEINTSPGSTKSKGRNKWISLRRTMLTDVTVRQYSRTIANDTHTRKTVKGNLRLHIVCSLAVGLSPFSKRSTATAPISLYTADRGSRQKTSGAIYRHERTPWLEVFQDHRHRQNSLLLLTMTLQQSLYQCRLFTYHSCVVIGSQ